MPIQFQCAGCQSSIRTADGTEGKPARCPRCGAVVIVPGEAPFVAEVSTAPSAPITPTFQDSPFAPQQPPAGGALNPYAPPANIFAADPFQHLNAAQAVERVRSRLLIPAIALIVVAICGLGFMAILGVVIAADPNTVFKDVGNDPAEQAGAYGFFVVYFTIGLITRIVQILGAINMLRVRGYSLAMAGAISAIIPCEVYCCLPCLPLGIWALIVLSNRDVKATFLR